MPKRKSPPPQVIGDNLAPATSKQKRLMRYLKIKFPERCSIATAQEYLADATRARIANAKRKMFNDGYTS